MAVVPAAAQPAPYLVLGRVHRPLHPVQAAALVALLPPCLLAQAVLLTFPALQALMQTDSVSMARDAQVPLIMLLRQPLHLRPQRTRLLRSEQPVIGFLSGHPWHTLPLAQLLHRTEAPTVEAAVLALSLALLPMLSLRMLCPSRLAPPLSCRWLRHRRWKPCSQTRTLRALRRSPHPQRLC